VRICIFSIMGGGVLGGSEEFWAGTANVTLDEGHTDPEAIRSMLKLPTKAVGCETAAEVAS
jgi:hypothetical protein